ncbi:MAG: hypothetical protein R2849_20565 [Thermomicrobiales bacterium]
MDDDRTVAETGRVVDLLGAGNLTAEADVEREGVAEVVNVEMLAAPSRPFSS